MKVAIYARVSTDKQDNADQLEQLIEFANKQNWEIVTEYKSTAAKAALTTQSRAQEEFTEAG